MDEGRVGLPAVVKDEEANEELNEKSVAGAVGEEYKKGTSPSEVPKVFLWRTFVRRMRRTESRALRT